MKPSEVTETYWIYRTLNPFFGSTHMSGKWIIEVPLEKLDETWDKVQTALLAGKLGIAAKTSTAMENKTQSPSHKDKIICCYVTRYDDEEEELKCLKGLREAGIKGKLKFKRDRETYAGIYGKNSFWMYSNSGTKVKRYGWTHRS